MRELLIGCGHSREKKFGLPGDARTWGELVTLDNNPECKPDILCDLRHPPYSSQTPEFFDGDQFDAIHAYEVLEHIGAQGDYALLFRQFAELWRLLKPGGRMYATCPDYRSVWAWGDPGHTRIINHGTLVFFDRQQYAAQLGKTSMSDYRADWPGDFATIYQHYTDDQFWFVLEARKP
jgi:SAM-dependent methyltransferase